MLIQPFYGLFMLVTCFLDNPNNHLRIFTRSIRNNLTQMVVISFFQLVLYDNSPPCPFLCSVQVNTKIAYIGFLFFDNYIYAHRFTKNL